MTGRPHHYVVLERYSHIEIRRYAPQVVAETRVEGSACAAGHEGFARLMGYLCGDNRACREIRHTHAQRQRADDAAEIGITRRATSQPLSMTGPVRQVRTAGGYTIAFVMPAEHTLVTLPEPSDPMVHLREVPSRVVAALRYSGSWAPAHFLQRTGELCAFLEARGMQPNSCPEFARYNRPWVPWFLRRNEVLVPLAWPAAGAGPIPASGLCKRDTAD